MSSIGRLSILLLIFGYWGIAHADSPVLSEALRIMETLHSTSYTHQPQIDEAQGIFELDCSAFATYVLSRSEPRSYAELMAASSEKGRPLAKDFVSFFKNRNSDDPQSLWLQIVHIANLKPGDLIAWLIPPGSTSKDTGHVMIVREVPTENPQNANEWLVAVVDSAVSGHGSLDPRRTSGPNGVGSGTIGLIANEKGYPVAFRWAGGQSPKTKYTDIRMARVK